MIFSPLKQHDTRLRDVSEAVGRQQMRTAAFQNEIEALLDFVYGRTSNRTPKTATPRTVGLSACQVGLMKRISIVDMAIGHKNMHDIRVLINPSVVWESTVLSERVEGCVNFNEWWGVTRRPSRIKIAALDRWGSALSMDVSGWAATLLSHEIDHLNGTLFIDRLINPREAHMVARSDFPEYKRSHAKTWPHIIDVSAYTKHTQKLS